MQHSPIASPTPLVRAPFPKVKPAPGLARICKCRERTGRFPLQQMPGRQMLRTRSLVAGPEQLEDASAQDSAPVEEPFDWDKCWYPVAVLNDIEVGAPAPVKLLDRVFVLLHGQDGRWKCWEEGSGTCTCSDEGLGSSSGCSRPPTGRSFCATCAGVERECSGPSTNSGQFPVMVMLLQEFVSCCWQRVTSYSFTLSRAAATSMCNVDAEEFACVLQVSNGIVWIWPDRSPSSFVECTTVMPNGHGEDVESKMTLRHLYMREVPYPLDFLIENVIDQSHLPYSHHGHIVSYP